MRHEHFKLVLATVIGNVMEWYDFALYGYFATVLGGLFFPSSEPSFSLLLTFSTFAVGIFARFFGSIWFGYFGDRYGRRVSLLLSVLLISLSTVSMGLLPTYATIGIWAPILLIVCRLIQGLAVSGELTTAGIYLIESSRHSRQGFHGSVVMCSTYIGLLLGALACTLVMSIFNTHDIEAFAWRIPFLCSLFLGTIALFLRLKSQDSPVFKSLLRQNEQSSKPVLVVFKSFLPRLLLIAAMSSILAVAIYLLIGYFPSYFMLYLGMTSAQAMMIIMCGLLSLTVLVPLLGFMSDRVGYYKLYGIGCLLFIVFVYGFLNRLHDSGLYQVLLSTMLLTIPLAFIAASIMPIIINLFPGYVRCTGVAIGYGSGMAVFGGTAPFVALYGAHYFEISLVPMIYLITTASISLVSVCYLQKLSKREGYLLQGSLACQHKFL